MKIRRLLKWLIVASVLGIIVSSFRAHARDLQNFHDHGWVDPDEGW